MEKLQKSSKLVVEHLRDENVISDLDPCYVQLSFPIFLPLFLL